MDGVWQGPGGVAVSLVTAHRRAEFTRRIHILKQKFASVDAYIAQFEPDVQKVLRSLRALIRKTAPKAEETISYHMPTYTLGRAFLYFTANKKHIGIYAAAPAIPFLEEELAPYITGRGTLTFPLSRPLPMGLLGKVIRIRVKQMMATEKNLEGKPARNLRRKRKVGARQA
jgi:uncharacterized protein YdhG (YjbR/CyaY superfamily)